MAKKRKKYALNSDVFVIYFFLFFLCSTILFFERAERDFRKFYFEPPKNRSAGGPINHFGICPLCKTIKLYFKRILFCERHG